MMNVTKRYHFPASILLFASCQLVLLVLSGCGDGHPERVRVSGTVLIDDKPLPKCSLLFIPPDGRPSRGTTDETGRFTLSCYGDNDGVLRGTHSVTITAVDAVNGNTLRWRAPKKYMNRNTSNLQFDISEPTDDLKIEITWDGDRPFLEREGVRIPGR